MKRIAVLTSGGDSPGMNPAIRSLTRTAINLKMEVWGIHHGYRGLLENDWVPLDALSVSGRSRDPGTFLQSSRCPEFAQEQGPKRALEILKKKEIDGLVVIGGDGSLRGALELHRLGMPVIGIPGTIDNDIYGTDMALGVDTALNTIISLVDMIKATATSHRRCFVVEVMGRGSGYLALMTTISTGCQVAVVPEFKLNVPRILEVLHGRFDHHHNNSVIIVAEGVCSGYELMQRLKSPDSGITPIKQEMRLTVLGHLQRGGVPSHFDRLLGTRMGELAVLALQHEESGMMTALCGSKMQLRALEEVLDKPKKLPSDAVRLAHSVGIELGAPFAGR